MSIERPSRLWTAERLRVTHPGGPARDPRATRRIQLSFWPSARAGSPAFLAAQGEHYGFRSRSYRCPRRGPSCVFRPIRAALSGGAVVEAAEMLGYPWLVTGAVVHGDQRGRELGFPTASGLDPACGLNHGIYAVRVAIGGKSLQRRRQFRPRPMFDVGARCSTHRVRLYRRSLRGGSTSPSSAVSGRSSNLISSTSWSAAWTTTAASPATRWLAPAAFSRRSVSLRADWRLLVVIPGRASSREPEIQAFGHAAYSRASPPLSLPGLTGQSSNPCAIDVAETLPHRESGGYWIARSPMATSISGIWSTRCSKTSSSASGRCRDIRSPYVPGWDCHGLPIEWKIEEENYRSKGKPKPDFSDPAAMIAFRRECRAYAEHWLSVQREEFKRLGVVGDWTHPYTTMDFNAEAQIARELMKFRDNGLLYRGSKPVMWSVVEKTALAEAEVEYEDFTSDTVWVKFPVTEVIVRRTEGSSFHLPGEPGGRTTTTIDPSFDDASVIIWTTTPWTLPGNRAISYSAKIAYGLFEFTKWPEGNWAKVGDKFILADKLADEVMKQAKVASFRKLRDFPVAVLCGMRVRHPLKGCGYDFRGAVACRRPCQRRNRHRVRAYGTWSWARGFRSLDGRRKPAARGAASDTKDSLYGRSGWLFYS